MPKIETTTDFTIECAKIENITGNRGMVAVEIKDGYIWPDHEKYVVKRLRKNYYFISYNGESISPALDYENLNSFMIGYKNCKEVIFSKLNSI